MTYTLRSAGYMLKALAPHSRPATTWAWGEGGGGLSEVSWEAQLPYDYDHPALRTGALVEVLDGAQTVGCGILAEPGRTDTGLAFTAAGLFRSAQDFVALDGAGNSTSTPDTAIDTAIGYGLQWTRPNSLSSTPLKSSDVNGANYVNAILDSLSDETGLRWWVDGDRAVHLDADPTVPVWQIRPGVIDFALADDTYASILVGRYINTSGNYKTVTATDAVAQLRFGPRMFEIDMSPLGQITSARAQARLNNILAKGRARLTFTDRVNVSPFDLLTIGGQPAPLSLVRGGQMVRAHGLDGDAAILNGANFVDFVIGEVIDDADDSISVAPVGLAATTLADNFAIPTADSTQKP